MGVSEDGTAFIALLDGEYRSVPRRAARETLLAIQFPGTYMMESIDRREDFEKSLAPFLAAHDGVVAAGLTRVKMSYTFLFYLGSDAITREGVSIPEDLQGLCHVWIARDPAWSEYESFLPPRRSVAQRARAWLTRFRGGAKQAGVLKIASGEGLDNQSVLTALATHGANLSKPAELAFYLYIPNRENADACAVTLWEHGLRARVARPLGKLPNGTSEERWSVSARLNIIPTVETVRSFTDLMNTLAEQHCGEYSGWEASVER